MGCLNSNGNFSHWFGNIHLSGPCNRRCYFCIGQHMMALDPLNNLRGIPKNIDTFIDVCNIKGVTEINLTGSNTDPSLYRNIPELRAYLLDRIPGLTFGVRTNGVKYSPAFWDHFDKGSISLTSMNPELYQRTMGCGDPPSMAGIRAVTKGKPIKVNIVLCPETVESGDIYSTISELAAIGFDTINLREPYGQPRVGHKLQMDYYRRVKDIFGMPTYSIDGASVTLWDVHYVEVESVNLYANGEVSEDYPVTRGHCPSTGTVKSQDQFLSSGRMVEQWRSHNARL